MEGPGSWHSAAVDVLEQQFPLYSRDSLHEMLDLHEGSLALALDMLAQLEAEMDGQLPSDGQVSKHPANPNNHTIYHDKI